MSFLRSCLAAFLLLPILPSALAADPPPVETFYRRPQFERMALSPDGKLLAAIVPARGRSNLAVIDLQTVKAQPITGFDNSDVIEFHWLGNKRLLLRSGDLREAQGSARYYGWFAIDADGKYVRRLTVPAVVQERTVRRENMMLEFGYLGRVPDADDEIFVAKYVSDSYTRQVYRLNTRDGATRLASLDSPPDPIGWVMDHAGVARVAISYRRGRVTVRYRDDPKAPWKTLAEGDQTSLDFNPLGFDYDNKTLFVSMRDGKDTAGIHIYDTDKNASKEVFVQHPLVDINHLVFSRGKKKLLGVTYEADKPGVVWLDGEMQRL